jgi:hypothetical protein
MRAAHGNDRHSLLRNGYQFLQQRACEVLRSLRTPIKVGSLTMHAKQKNQVNDLRKCRVHSTSRAPCHSTAMVQRCTDNLHSILFLALQYLSTSLIKLASLTY